MAKRSKKRLLILLLAVAAGPQVAALAGLEYVREYRLSDDTRRDLKTSTPEKRAVNIPKGTGRHRVRLAE